MNRETHIPVVEFPNSHAAMTLAHCARQIERIKRSQDALRSFAQASGDVFLVSDRCGPHTPSIDIYTGHDGRERALSVSEFWEYEGENPHLPKPDFLACIVLHENGTWEAVDLFGEPQP